MAMTLGGFDLATALRAFDAAGASIGIFVAFRLPRKSGRAAKADRLLSAILLICAANVVHGAIDVSPRLSAAFVLEPLQFLLPLGIVWYLRALQGGRAFSAADAVNIVLPALFIAASYSPRLIEPRLPNGIPLLSLAMWLAMSLSSAFLALPAARSIHRYRAQLKQEFSSLRSIDPGWLQFILALMGCLFLLYALLAILMIHAPEGLSPRPALAALTSAFTIGLAWAALGRSQERLRLRGRRDGGEKGTETDHRPAPVREPDEGRLAKARSLIALIEERRLFLEPELSLDDLAREAGMSRHLVSEALNRGLGTSFFELVNRYRIEEFQRLCSEPGKRDEKIMTLALEAGFNSKPSFNLVFKRTTGMTPSQYRSSVEKGSTPIG